MDAHAPSTPWTILSIPWSGTSPSNPSINQATTRRANVSDFAADFLCGTASGTGIGKQSINRYIYGYIIYGYIYGYLQPHRLQPTI